MLKIYFWLVNILMIMAAFGGLFVQGFSGFGMMIGAFLILWIFPLLPTYSYVFKKKFLSPRIWKGYLLVVSLPSIFLLGMGIYANQSSQEYFKIHPELTLLTLYILPLLPGYYSLYKLAFKKQ